MFDVPVETHAILGTMTPEQEAEWVRNLRNPDSFIQTHGSWWDPEVGFVAPKGGMCCLTVLLTQVCGYEVFNDDGESRFVLPGEEGSYDPVAALQEEFGQDFDQEAFIKMNDGGLPHPGLSSDQVIRKHSFEEIAEFIEALT